MEYLRFTNGFEISSADLAAAIRREGRLGTGAYNNNGLRCALGVALEIQGDYSNDNTIPDYDAYRIVDTNDDEDEFQDETPEERAERMAQYIESEIWAEEE